MSVKRKPWFILTAAVLGMAFIACTCPAISPTTTPGSETSTPQPPVAPPTATQAPATSIPMAGLAGYWQEGPRVFTIQWQNDQYVVTAIDSADSSTRTLKSQSWDGTMLTWTYTYTDELGSNDITYSTISIQGDTLTANYSKNGSTSSNVHKLIRTTGPTPADYPLPFSDNFSDTSSGWDVFSTDKDAAGYGSGYYFVTSKTTEFSSYGAAGRYYSNLTINVDATPFSTPSDNRNWSYNVGCRLQANADGYIFEVEGDGYYAVGYYTGAGKKYVSLFSGSDQWLLSNSVKQGKNLNHLTVTCDGSNLAFAINGTTVWKGQDSTFKAGDISLGAATYDKNNTPAEIHFTNLQVSTP